LSWRFIQRKDGKAAGAIVGFANTLLRLYEAERPGAVVVGWDTIEVPHRAAQEVLLLPSETGSG